MKIEIIKPTDLPDYDEAIDKIIKHINRVASHSKLNVHQIMLIGKLSKALYDLSKSSDVIVSGINKVGKFTDLNKPKIDIPKALSKRIEVEVEK